MKRTIGIGLAVLLVLTVATPALAYTLTRWLGNTTDWHLGSNWTTGVKPDIDSQCYFNPPDMTGTSEPNIGATAAVCGKVEMSNDYLDPITFSGTATLTIVAGIGSYRNDITVNCPLITPTGAPRLTAAPGTTLALNGGLTTTGTSAVVAGTGGTNDAGGTLLLPKPCTGTSQWEVYGGTLMVTNLSGSATGSGKVVLYRGTTVNATLAGTGSVGGEVVNLGSIAPGLSIGELNVDGNVTFYDAGTLDIETGGGSSLDLLTIGGDLILGTVDTDYTNTLNFTGPGAVGPFITYGGTLTGLTGEFDTESGVPAGFSVDYTTYPNEVWLVPEPATLALLGLGGLGLLVRRKR